MSKEVASGYNFGPWLNLNYPNCNLNFLSVMPAADNQRMKTRYDGVLL